MNLKRYAAKGSSGDKTPEPYLEYRRIPKERYISHEFKKKEWEGVWKKVWIQAGLDRDVKEPGDFFTTAVCIYQYELSEHTHTHGHTHIYTQ